MARVTWKQKRRAKGLVYLAIKRGHLKRPAICQDCGNPPVDTLHAHHEDYSKPLDVVFVCRRCHKSRHRKTARIDTAIWNRAQELLDKESK